MKEPIKITLGDEFKAYGIIYYGIRKQHPRHFSEYVSLIEEGKAMSIEEDKEKRRLENRVESGPKYDTPDGPKRWDELTQEQKDEINRPYREKRNKEELGIERMIEIFQENGIRMSIWGCGCCNSPRVRFEYLGEMIVEETEEGEEEFGVENAGINMFGDGPDD
jgi:hypothetical protein